MVLPFGVNFNLPGKEFPTIGALASEMPESYLKFDGDAGLELGLHFLQVQPEEPT